MKITIDAREYALSPPITGAARRGTEDLLHRIAGALATKNEVHVVTAEKTDHHVEGIFWWPEAYFPRGCDVLIACERLDRARQFKYDRLFMTLNRIDPTLAGLENTVEGALSAAQLFNSNDTIPGDLLSGLSEEQLAECVNWDFLERQPIPTLSEWGLIAMAGILGIVGFMVIRRRKVTA